MADKAQEAELIDALKEDAVVEQLMKMLGQDWEEKIGGYQVIVFMMGVSSLCIYTVCLLTSSRFVQWFRPDCLWDIYELSNNQQMRASFVERFCFVDISVNRPNSAPSIIQ